MVNDHGPTMAEKRSLRELLASRDPEATTPFVLEHYAWALGRARARGGAQHAEDIVQDVFRELLERPPKGLETAGARAVITVMISDHVIARYHKAKKMLVGPLWSDLLGSASNLSTLARRERVFQEVVSAMQRLQTMHRALLEMRYFEGLRPVDIARQMSLTDAAVRGQLFRAMGCLREELGLSAGR